MSGSALTSPPVDASATQRGLVNIKAQSFKGVKTFVDGISVESLDITGDITFGGATTTNGIATFAGGLFVPTGQTAQVDVLTTADTSFSDLYLRGGDAPNSFSPFNGKHVFIQGGHGASDGNGGNVSIEGGLGDGTGGPGEVDIGTVNTALLRLGGSETTTDVQGELDVSGQVRSFYTGANVIAGTAVFHADFVANSAPTLANFGGALEMGGNDSAGGALSADVYIGSMWARDTGFIASFLNNYGTVAGGVEQEVFKVGFQGNLYAWGNIYLGQNGTPGRVTSDSGGLYLVSAGPTTHFNNTTGDIVNWYSGAGALNSANLAADGTFTSIADFESTVAGKGFVLKSPNGTRFRISVSNAGVLSAAAA